MPFGINSGSYSMQKPQTKDLSVTYTSSGIMEPRGNRYTEQQLRHNPSEDVAVTMFKRLSYVVRDSVSYTNSGKTEAIENWSIAVFPTNYHRKTAIDIYKILTKTGYKIRSL